MEAAINTPPGPPAADTVLQEADSSALVALIDDVFSQQNNRRRHYSMKQKRDALVATEGMSQRKAASTQGVSRWTFTTEKALSRAPDRPEILPFKVELITFMKDTRRDSRSLTASIMASYIRDEHASWVDGYVKEKKDTSTAYESLLRLLRRFAYRHGFVQRTPHGLKEKLEDLETVQQDFAKFFKKNYVAYKPSEIFNCDETGIYFDMPPAKSYPKKGNLLLSPPSRSILLG
ncbi:hypothetical protein PHMEG_00035099 [Phytophthora megakarya]|uniref:Uncharacterized protein n=1 Tax=Phytophthora megakarya TaxID=4795 RepID=A0A225UPN8_9STRA|nr:hypothetical protein PHMEG_00035099 [Phytophthora megakarya]